MFQTFLWLTGTFHCITALAVSVLIWYRVRYNPLKSFPGPRMTYPIFGVLAHLEKRNGSIKEMLERLREKYGRIRRIYLPFGKSRIEISDPKWIHYVMSTNSKNYNRGGKASLSVLKLVVGKSSLVMTSGALHKHLRTLANPAFRQVLLTEFLTIFSRVTERLTQVWDDQLSNSNNNKVEIFVRDYFARLTLDTIGLTAFGYDFKSFSPQSNDTTKAFHFMTRVKFSILQFLPGFNLMTRFIAYFSKYRGFSEISEFFYHIRKLREEIRSLIARKNNAKDNKSARNLLLILSEAEKDGKLTSEELEDMMMTLIAAGHDTSSVALTWLFYLLAKNPEIQEKCREETFQILSNDTDITWEQLMAHEYLLATIKETLRLYPPIPYVR